MWLMLQQDCPTIMWWPRGSIPVREFAEIAFDHVGLDYREYVTVDPKFFRPAEVHLLLGDAAKARKQLKWEPASVSATGGRDGG